MSIVAGIDISKETLDLSLNGQSKTFKNTTAGHRELEKQLKKANVDWVVMEATGKHHEAIAIALSQAKFSVSVINPARSFYYAKSLGRRTKTDKVDARTLAEFGSRNLEELTIYVPPSLEEREFKALVRMRDNLVTSRVEVKNRLSEASLCDIEVQLLSTQIGFFDEQIKLVETKIKALIKSSQELCDVEATLRKIDGFGRITAWTFMAEIPDFNRFDGSKKIAAFIGICPSIRQSGNSIHSNGSISRTGNRRLRQALYMAAMATIRMDNQFQRLYVRLLTKGKPKMVALVAVMHKMVRIAYKLVTSGKTFDPKHGLTTNS